MTIHFQAQAVDVGLDLITPPRYGRAVADGIPGARFEVLAEEAHQPFQEGLGGGLVPHVEVVDRVDDARGA
jgi:hypothetical protein